MSETKNIQLRWLYILFGSCLILIMMSTIACGKRCMVKGRTVDAITKIPIQGAVIAINWRDQSFGLPGLGAPSKVIEEYETVSDKDGSFEIPDYTSDFSTIYHMGAYKQGYVCWSSQSVFFPNKEKRKKKVERRENDIAIKDGMTVFLKPLPEEYSKIEHGSYAEHVCGIYGDCGDLFRDAIRDETLEYHKEIKRRYIEHQKIQKEKNKEYLEKNREKLKHNEEYKEKWIINLKK